MAALGPVLDTLEAQSGGKIAPDMPIILTDFSYESEPYPRNGPRSAPGARSSSSPSSSPTTIRAWRRRRRTRWSTRWRRSARRSPAGATTTTRGSSVHVAVGPVQREDPGEGGGVRARRSGSASIPPPEGSVDSCGQARFRPRVRADTIVLPLAPRSAVARGSSSPGSATESTALLLRSARSRGRVPALRTRWRAPERRCAPPWRRVGAYSAAVEAAVVAPRACIRARVI